VSTRRQSSKRRREHPRGKLDPEFRDVDGLFERMRIIDGRRTLAEHRAAGSGEAQSPRWDGAPADPHKPLEGRSAAEVPPEAVKGPERRP
jgi:hypothetical protein